MIAKSEQCILVMREFIFIVYLFSFKRKQNLQNYQHTHVSSTKAASCSEGWGEPPICTYSVDAGTQKSVPAVLDKNEEAKDMKRTGLTMLREMASTHSR